MMTKQEHIDTSIALARMAQQWTNAWNETVNMAAKEYGDGDGKLISGIYRSHYPETIKNALRLMCKLGNECTDNSLKHWTIGARRRAITWRRMVAELGEE
jgi:hypothetical protein